MIIELLKTIIMMESLIGAILSFGLTTRWDGEPHFEEWCACLACIIVFGYMCI